MRFRPGKMANRLAPEWMMTGATEKFDNRDQK
jgi:hypothetical protein